MANSNDSDGRYLPFNLSSVTPFEATAAALRNLSTVQPRPPAGPQLLPVIRAADSPCDADTKALMLRMLADTAREGEWVLEDKEQGPLPESSRPPSWVQDVASSIPSVLRSISAKQRQKPAAGPRPSKRPRRHVTSEEASQDLHPVKTQRNIPDDVKPPEQTSEDEEQREDEVREAQVLAKEEAVRGFIAVLVGLVDRIESQMDRSGCSVGDARLRATANSLYIHELMQTVQVNVQLINISLVPQDVLSCVVAALMSRVLVCQSSVSSKSTSTASSEIVSDALTGVRCASTVLTILACEGTPRSLLVQETLDSVLQMLKTSCVNILYPAFDPLYVAPAQCSKKVVSDDVTTIESEEADLDTSDREDSRLSGGRSRRGKSGKPRARPVASGKVKELQQDCCVLFETFGELLNREKGLADSFLSNVLSLAISSLSVDGVTMLQVSAGKAVESLVYSHPNHDVDVLDGLREQLAKLPANRRNLRRYRLHTSSSQVRVSSALLCKVGNAILGRASAKVDDGKPEEDRLFEERRNRCMRLAFRLIDDALGRVVQDRDPEYRTAFQSWVGDLLEMFALPEWPAAELAVQALAIRLVLLLRKGGDVSVYARSLALDMLGLIAGRVCTVLGSEMVDREEVAQRDKQDHPCVNRDLLVSRRCAVVSYLRDESKSDSSLRSAEQAQVTLFMIDDADADEGKLRESSTTKDEAGSPTTTDFVNIRVTAAIAASAELAAHLRSNCNGSSVCRHDAVQASSFICSRRTFGRQLPKIVSTICDGLIQPEPTLRTKAIKSLSYVADCEPALFRKIPSLLAAIESSCIDVSKSVREASLDLLARTIFRSAGSSVVNAEKSLDFAEEERRKRSLVEKIFPIVQQRLVDSAVSVRKRAVSILESMLHDCMAGLKTAAGETRALRLYLEETIVRVCCTLACRLEDRESSVSTLVERSLRLALFGFDPTHPGLGSANSRDELSARDFAYRIVALYAAVMKVPKPTGSQRNVLPLVLHDAIVVKRRPLLVSIAAEMVDMLHSCESALADSPSTLGFGSREVDLSTPKSDVDVVLVRRLACSSALEALVDVDSSLGAPHCNALAPYVKGIVEVKRRSGADILHMQRILGVLERCIPRADRGFSVQSLDEVVRDVEKIVCMCPSPGIAPAAIKCFCSLAAHSDDSELSGLPEETARVFFSFLSKSSHFLTSASSQVKPETIRNAKQALPRLGLLARYACLGPEFVKDVYALLDTLCRGLTSEWMPGSRLGTFAQQEHVASNRQVLGILSLRISVIQALTHFLVRHRKFLPTATEFLVGCLQQGQGRVTVQRIDFEAQLTVLSGLHEILHQEELRNLSAARTIGKELSEAAPGAKNNVVLAAEEDAEAGYLAACAQALVPELHRSSRSESADVRKAVVHSLGLLARQGLILPATIVPALFGLLVDVNGTCRETALQVVGFLAERHPTMLSSAAAIGVRHSFSHAVLWRPTSGPVTRKVIDEAVFCAVDKKTGYSLLSGALMLIPREQRRGILSGLIREFDLRAKSGLNNVDATAQKPPSQGLSDDHGSQSRLPEVFPQLSRRESSEVAGQGESQEFGVDLQCSNGPVQAPLYPNGPADDDDDDVAPARSSDLSSILRVSSSVSSLSSLAFYATTLATMDYAGGAGIGGSLTCGGGTAAADNKLRVAREDVMEITAIASRIISNSGQAVLQAIQETAEPGSVSYSHRNEIAHSALPLCILLLLKKFLRHTRWTLAPTQPEAKEDDVDGECVMPLVEFSLSRIPFAEDAVQKEEAPTSRSTPTEAQLNVFRELMREDSIEEEDLAAGLGGNKKPSRRRSSAGAGRGALKARRSKGGQSGNPEVLSRSGRSSAAVSRRNSRNKVVRATGGLDDVSDDAGDSDYEGPVE